MNNTRNLIISLLLLFGLGFLFLSINITFAYAEEKRGGQPRPHVTGPFVYGPYGTVLFNEEIEKFAEIQKQDEEAYRKEVKETLSVSIIDEQPDTADMPFSKGKDIAAKIAFRNLGDKDIVEIKGVRKIYSDMFMDDVFLADLIIRETIPAKTTYVLDYNTSRDIDRNEDNTSLKSRFVYEVKKIVFKDGSVLSPETTSEKRGIMKKEYMNTSGENNAEVRNPNIIQGPLLWSDSVFFVEGEKGPMLVDKEYFEKENQKEQQRRKELQQKKEEFQKETAKIISASFVDVQEERADNEVCFSNGTPNKEKITFKIMIQNLGDKEISGIRGMHHYSYNPFSSHDNQRNIFFQKSIPAKTTVRWDYEFCDDSSPQYSRDHLQKNYIFEPETILFQDGSVFSLNIYDEKHKGEQQREVVIAKLVNFEKQGHCRKQIRSEEHHCYVRGSIDLKNTGDKEIIGIKGSGGFKNIVGENLASFTVKVVKEIKPGERQGVNFVIEVQSFPDLSEQELSNLLYFVPKTIVFKDGTRSTYPAQSIGVTQNISSSH